QAPLSVLRGITCAAFVVACHQAALMKKFLDDVYVLKNLDAAVLNKIAGMFETKGAVRERAHLAKAELTEGAQRTLDEKSKSKAVYVGQAARGASNRQLLDKSKTTLATQREKQAGNVAAYPEIFDATHQIANIPDVELLWLNIQALL